MSESYEAYSAPHPKTRFSPQFMANATLGEVVGLVRHDLLPRILPDGSVSKWNWDQTVPVTIPETIVSSREEIPSMADMQPIMADAKQAFYELRVNSVCIQFKSGAIVRYHFSKLRLIVGANNQDYNFRLMSRLLARVERESLLSPALFEKLKLNRFSEPLAGFSVTQTPLYNLGCLLDERWILDDIMNARAEFIYFRRAAMLQSACH
ncbi:SF3b1 domain-containing protein [Favolaschia claudopus]|uniref:SF3b1 domain-containing protein n=1 Tax=Favolaschia claudopus TaxID=2862362 RepID=A0AAW0A1E2_9AGAR